MNKNIFLQLIQKIDSSGIRMISFLALKFATDVHAGIAWASDSRLAHSIYAVHLGDNLCRGKMLL